MEFLKELFNGGALTYDQLEEAVNGKGYAVVNAADGAYIPKSQYDAVTGQLTDANRKLEGYDPEWKNKAEALQRKLDSMQFEHALEKGIAAAKPRNARAIAGLIDREKLKLSGGELIGLDAQIKALKEGESTAFLFSEEPKQSTGMSHQNNGDGSTIKSSAANDALRAIFRGGK